MSHQGTEQGPKRTIYIFFIAELYFTETKTSIQDNIRFFIEQEVVVR